MEPGGRGFDSREGFFTDIILQSAQSLAAMSTMDTHRGVKTISA